MNTFLYEIRPWICLMIGVISFFEFRDSIYQSICSVAFALAAAAIISARLRFRLSQSRQ